MMILGMGWRSISIGTPKTYFLPEPRIWGGNRPGARVRDARGVRENASRGHGCCVVSQFQRRFRVCCILFAVGDRWGAKREAKSSAWVPWDQGS